MATKEKNFRRQKYLKSKIKNGNTFSKVVGTEILFISIKKLNEIENIYDRILVLFFLNDHRPSKPLPFVAKGWASTNPFSHFEKFVPFRR